MSLANQQLGKYIHGDKVVGSPTHGGKVPVHGQSFTATSNPAGPVHGSANPDGSGPPSSADPAFHFKADSITPQTDNTAIGSWTDSIAGISMTQATGANQPKYRTSRIGSKPAIQFVGSQWFTLGRPAALTNMLANDNTATGATMFFVVGNLAAIDDNWNCLWSPSNVNDGNRTILMDNGRCGSRGDPRLFVSLGNGFHVIVVRTSSVYAGQFFHNMNAYSAGSLSDAGAPQWQVGGDGSATDAFTFKGDIMEIGGYNKALTTADVANLVKYACNKYGQAYPWAGASRFIMFDGDSQTFGTGATATANRADFQNGWAQLLMDLKGQPFGAWSNVAVPGRSSAQMTASAPGHYTGLAAALGIPVVLACMEYYNTPDTNAGNMIAYLTAVKAADSGIKTLVLTSVDNGDATGQPKHDNRPAFNTALSAAGNSDVKCPIHTDAFVGVDGACPDGFGASTYFADGIHPNNAGYAKMRDFVSSYYDTAIAL